MGDQEARAVTPRKMQSLQKLASTNFTRFAIQVQHLSTDVQLKIIEQLPEFRKLATEAIDKISSAHETTLQALQHAEDQAADAFEEWRESLREMLKDPGLTVDDKLRITAQIGETVKEQIAYINAANKAKMAMYAKTVLGIVGMVGLVAAAIVGGKFAIEQGDNDA